MLRYYRSPAKTSTGTRIYLGKLNIKVRPTRYEAGPTLEFLHDTLSYYTVLDIHHAFGMGRTPDEIRTYGEPIELVSGSGHVVDAYLYPVWASTKDPFGGWAEWETDFAFRESPQPRQPGGRRPLARSLAGQVGFHEFFDPQYRGQFFDLDPRSHTPVGKHFDYTCSQTKLQTNP